MHRPDPKTSPFISPQRSDADLPRLLFSQKEAAKILNISVRTLQNLIAAKQLSVRRIGRRVLVHRGELERFARRDHLVIGGRYVPQA
jgi:excisionase family DNA binding protein